MPSADTFDCPPIEGFVRKYLAQSQVSVDPFARNKLWATYTNDLNPNTRAFHHMDAEAFLVQLSHEGVKADLVLFDPPYSPRQISECYKEAGLKVTMRDTQNAALYKRVRDAAMNVLDCRAIVLSFGWNSSGMGQKRNFEQIEILLCCHGGAHNDTICLAERKITTPQQVLRL